MSSDKDNKKDLTRIEDLSDFLHDEDEEFLSLEDLDQEPDKTKLVDLPEELELSSEEDFPAIGDDDELDINSEDDQSFSDIDTPQEDDFSFEEQSTDFTEQVEDFPESENELELEEDEINESLDSLTEEQFDENIAELTEKIDHIKNDLKDESLEKPNNETFEDIAQTEQNLISGSHAIDGNPPFSIIIENIKFQEDADEIIKILENFEVFKIEQMEQVMVAISRGSLLIPRISEFLAIHLTHRLRHLNILLKVGLTEEISPPKNYQSDDRGLVSKKSLLHNKKQFFKFNKKVKYDEIITTNAMSIPNYEVLKYFGLISCLKIASDNQVIINQEFESNLKTDKNQQNHQMIDQLQVEASNKQASKSLNYTELDFSPNYHQYKKDIQFIFNELTLELKQKAFEQQANAVLGIQFQITPLNKNIIDALNYQITATGNLAWIQPN